MKNILVVFAVVLPCLMSAQDIQIPDQNFLTALIEQGLDLNGDGIIQESEAKEVVQLDVSGRDIERLEGLSFFDELVDFDCSYNSIDYVDLSMNRKLRRLICKSNRLQDIDLTYLLDLQILECNGNRLKTLVCSSSKLTYLNCSSNNLNNLEIGNCPDLTFLYCRSNELSDLDLENNINLFEIDCEFNYLETLDVGDKVFLSGLSCASNRLETLRLENNVALTKIRCFDNQLSVLNLNACTRLEELHCANNNIELLDLTNLIFLSQLYCGINVLSDLDLNGNPNLSVLYCNENLISELSLINNPYLNNVDCSENKLKELVVENKLYLRTLNCSGNDIDELKISNTSELTYLNCSGNELTHLDLNDNEVLHTLDCSYNDLKCLDLLANDLIDRLFINDNPNLNLLNLSISGIFHTNFSNTDLRSICGPKNLWDDLPSEDVQNVIFTENCNVFRCGERMVSGSIVSSSYNCIRNDLITFADWNFKLEIADDVFTVSSYGMDSFRFFLPSELLKITPIISHPDLFELDPAFYEIDLNENVSSLNFCLSPTDILKLDLNIDLFTSGMPRPGETHRYSIQYENYGNTATDALIKFNFEEDVMEFVNSDDDWQWIDGELFLEVKDMAPLEKRTSSLTFVLNTPLDIPPLDLGSSISAHVEISSDLEDCNRIDNFSFITEEVVNSSDPNDKTCMQGKYILKKDSTSYSLSYRLRFENIGTVDALNISIIDTIDLNVFDIRTVDIISSSDPVQMNVNGAVLEFVFSDINLPFQDEFNDGYVIFEIDTWDNLPLHTEISNTADIYFDYNYPIRTNTSVSYIVEDRDGDGFHSLKDCEDSIPSINPSMIEIAYNGFDDDCNDLTLDDDLDQDGFGLDVDCDDTNPDINPDADDIPNNRIDENCDGEDLISAVNDVESLGFSIFPNPVLDVVYLVQTHSLNMQVEFFDSSGKNVLNYNVTDQSSVIDLTGLMSGIYVLRIRTGEQVIYHRLLVK